jgi:ribose transport system permease protein
MTTATRPNVFQLRRSALGQSYLFALLLLVCASFVMWTLNPNFFRPAILNGNLRTYIPLMLLAAGQTIVVMAGGIDLSVGAIVSLANVVMVTAMAGEPNAGQIIAAIGLGLLVGVIAGIFNGLCVAYLRFQPIVTTFASSFVFGGLALYIMPSPGGTVPAALTDAYIARPLGIPLALFVAAVVVLVWVLVRATRFGRYLYAVGGQPMAAYVTGVPVNRVRLATYAISGLMAAFAALTLMLSTGTGDALIGNPLTLGSVVAVVIGGTRLSGGQGGVVGSLIGVIVLGLIRSIISFANVPTWWQTLADSLIVMFALAGPGFLALVRRIAKKP